MNENAKLDFASEGALSGYRLKTLEVLNWGTFNEKVWSLHLDGKNSLLTGDIGSGKSTLVDAVTTLLVPANKVDYNKAAGAEKKERNLRSYVLGYFKSERNESTGKSKPVALRDRDSYSVILGVFYNQGYDDWVTLAQVFWMKELQGQPERFYVTAEKELSIKRDFAQFGSEISALRKRLRKDDCEVMEHFPQYGAWFRRRFGIENDQALDLFHQTVSMKSVGNLTEFVRGHMLEPFDVSSRIQALINHFDDLSRAHEEVLKARRQIDQLTPLVANCVRHQQQRAQVNELRESRDALASYFAQIKLELLLQRLEQLQIDRTRQQNKVSTLGVESDNLRSKQQELKQQIAENGGDRIERLRQQIKQQQAERERRSSKADRYRELLEALSLETAKNASTFAIQQQELQQRLEHQQQALAELGNSSQEVKYDFRSKKDEHQTLLATIAELKSRQSNIDRKQIQIRQLLCESLTQKGLSIEPSDFAFAGELIQVRDEDKDWEGAIERLMHNFGLSMLVPDEYYDAVAQWVDDTHLGGRLVYYRIRQAKTSGLPSLHPNSLVRKIAIKPDSEFYAWLEQGTAKRFDLACCDNQQQFRRESRAITKNGQIKTSVERHEKDDRSSLNDRSRFILGWSNKDKIATLEGNARLLERQMQALALQITGFDKQERQLAETVKTIMKLEEYPDFEEIDWQPVARDIAKLQDELQQLESASDLLKTLSQRLKELEGSIFEHDAKVAKAHNEAGTIDEKIATASQLQIDTSAIIDGEETQQLQLTYERLAQCNEEVFGAQKTTVESCDSRQQKLRKWLQDKIDVEDRQVSRLQEKIIKAMAGYKNDYKLETQDMDAAVEAADEYQQMLTALEADDLPRFELRFKSLLNENTIREVANFQSQLHRERETIKERIDLINDSLTRIDYNPGRYIKLEAQPSQDAEIRDFQAELRSCTEGAITGSEEDQYSENKFLQVKRIIERFRGREGLTDQDRRWTRKVSDVRNWFSFAATERWREDDSEYEHYSDSGGKSGGQKEKLAYTILAASLTYQFGLEWGAADSRTFRFVVIDEAFGRGSDESADYGLKLFEQLNLQLLIVTPLQKIHIIEPYVASVGFVHNVGGSDSRLRNLTIEAYQLEKSQMHEPKPS